MAKYIMSPSTPSEQSAIIGGVRVPRKGGGVELPEAEAKILISEGTIVEVKGKKGRPSVEKKEETASEK